MHKGSVQRQVGDDNKLQQPETRLYEEMDKLWMLMERITTERYIKKRRTINNNIKLTERDYDSMMCGKQQNVVWALGKLKTLTNEGYNKANLQLQNKIWDPRVFNY